MQNVILTKPFLCGQYCNFTKSKKTCNVKSIDSNADTTSVDSDNIVIKYPISIKIENS